MKRRWQEWLALWTIAALVVGACSMTGNSTVDGTPPTGTSRTGKFVWHDLLTADAEAAMRFYEGLLGWEFERTTRLGETYYLARLNGELVGGVVPVRSRERDRRISQWLGYVSVPSVERAVREVEARGGSVASGPRDLGAVGRAAIVRDLAGAPLGLATVASGDPPDVSMPAPGRFFWMEYLASDVSAALAFYHEVVGYSAENTSTMAGHYYLLKTDRDRAGLYANPVPESKSVWLPYVRVEDPAALSERVADLGGRVLLSPASGVREGSLAIVADPSGAVLALQRYPL